MFVRLIPYLSLGLGSILVLLLSQIVHGSEPRSVLLGVFSNSVFFFLVYFLYDLIRLSVTNREKRLLLEYIRRDLSASFLAILYSLKKVIHGYNLESNSLGNIVGQVNYTPVEVLAAISNQSYLGFQILKKTSDMQGLLGEAINSNLVLKYSSHTEITRLLQMGSNLAVLEAALRNADNFVKQAESGVEFRVLSAKELNHSNPDGMLLVKITAKPDMFVVYDSGQFDIEDQARLLNRYTLKREAAKQIADLVSSTLNLMKTWLPDSSTLKKRDKNYRVVQNFYNPNTTILTGDVEIHIADIIKGRSEA